MDFGVGDWPIHASLHQMFFWRSLTALSLTLGLTAAPLPDTTFSQETAVRITRSAELEGALLLKLCITRDDVPYVLTSKGVAREFDGRLALDRSFRPITGNVAMDIATTCDGKLYYLYADGWLANEDAGLHQGRLTAGQYQHIAVDTNGLVLLAGTNGFALADHDLVTPLDLAISGPQRLMSVAPTGVWFSDGESIWRLQGRQVIFVGKSSAIRVMDTSGPELALVTGDGLVSFDCKAALLTQRLPSQEINSLVHGPGGWWVGTSKGFFFAWDGTESRWAGPSGGPAAPPPTVRYFAGRRWLADDQVIGVQPDSNGTVWVLTKTALQAIRYPSMTLATKAMWYEQLVRSRHIRYGLTAERRLPVSGDVSSSEMIDTDNDWAGAATGLRARLFAMR